MKKYDVTNIINGKRLTYSISTKERILFIDSIYAWLKENIPNSFLEHYGRWWLYVATEEDYLMFKMVFG